MSSALRNLKTLFWEATLACNASCDFCGSRCGEVFSKEIDASIICKTLKEIAEVGNPTEIMINVTGGEPLLRQDLFQVMAHADRLGFPWGMVTNGSLITEEVVGQMKKTHMRTISISIDGLYESHEQTRKLPGSFLHIMEAIQILHEADFLDYIQITTVVTKKNLQDLEEMYDYFSELPVDSWRLALIDSIGRGEDCQNMLLDKEDLEQWRAFMDRHVFSDKLTLTTSCSHYLGKWDNVYRSHPFYCGAGKTVASILADGSIYVCPNVPRIPSLIQGNIQKDSFVAVWENGFSWFLRPENRRTGACVSCEEWDRCQGDSLHTWDFETENPKFCLHQCAPEMWRRKEGEKDLALPDILRKSLKQQMGVFKGLKISYGSTSGHIVFFLPAAAEELYHYFHWGQRHPASFCELMAGMAGHREGDIIYVESLIPAHLEQRGEQEAAFSAKTHAHMEEELRIMNRYKDESEEMYRIFSGEFQLVGYIHSHPGTLRTELSLPDRKLHQLLKESREDFYIRAIVNPHSRILNVYWDSIHRPVDVVLLMGEEEVSKWGIFLLNS